MPFRAKVLIPALNEEHAVSKVIRAIPRALFHIQVDEVIVVDNGSQDRTAAVARAQGATVLEEFQQGYGRACLCGLAYIAQTVPQPDVVVFLDADYSDHPEEMSSLLAPIVSDQADLVIGSRTLGKREKGAMNLAQRLGNAWATWLLRVLYGGRFTDLGPFRAIRYRALQSLGMEDTDYGWTVEMQIKATRQGLRCLEVPVSYRRRVGVSKISGTWRGVVAAGYTITYTLFKYYRWTSLLFVS